jgi:uncharacterized damage-inducible protein DinB
MMSATHPPEVWLRGPLPNVGATLQPVAHSLLQCREEVHATLDGMTSAQLTARPGGAASVAYHLRHAMGSLDRLFTYARGESLTAGQLAALASEPGANGTPATAQALMDEFDAAVDRALTQLRDTGETIVLERREVGRAKLPSTVLGLLFHAAEHTQRHLGQAVTTARIVRAV